MNALVTSMPSPFKRMLHGLFRTLGYQLVPAGHTNAFELTALRNDWLVKLETDLVIDVGANIGQYVQNLRADGYSGDIVSFEPQRAAFEKLSRALKGDKRWRGMRYGLGNQTGELTLQIANNSMSSSLLPMLDSHSDALPESQIIGIETVPVCRLDEALKDDIGDVRSAFLKIDTQGYEAPVLEGAEGIMDRVSMVELELSLIPLYDGQELLADMINRMEKLGFVPIAIEHGFTDPVRRRVLQVDGLFVANDRVDEN